LRQVYKGIAVGMTAISVLAGYDLYREWMVKPEKAIMIVVIMEMSRVTLLFIFASGKNRSIALPGYLVISFFCGIVAITSFAVEFQKKDQMAHEATIKLAAEMAIEYESRKKKEIEIKKEEMDVIQKRIDWVKARGRNAYSLLGERDRKEQEIRSVSVAFEKVILSIDKDPTRAMRIMGAQLGLAVAPAASAIRGMIDRIGIDFVFFQILLSSILVLVVEVSIPLAALASFEKPTITQVRKIPKSVKPKIEIGQKVKDLRDGLEYAFDKKVVSSFLAKFGDMISEGKLPSEKDLSKAQRHLREWIKMYWGQND
jgi:hypothetical protein